jgi:uncharacterized delta-60 repeat protein
MTLITRQGKGEKITIEEMDNNLLYLESIGIPDITGITSNLQPFVEDKIDYINKITLSDKKTLYKGLLYNESQSPIREINLKYNESETNQVDIDGIFGKSYYLNANLSILLSNGSYNNSILFSAQTETNPLYDPNNIEPPFNIGDGFDNGVTSIQLQPDGKILVGGYFSSYDSTTSNRIIRLNSDGTIDNTFITGDGFDDTVFTIALQPDGKILVGGSFSSYDGEDSSYIIRLNSDGTIDGTFNIGNGFDNGVTSIQLQSDGKILVGGGFTTYNGITRNRIIRLNSDGTIDNTFNIGTGFDGDVNTIAIQSNGRITVGGWFSSYNGTSRNYIIRLNSNGSIDNTFGVLTGFNAGIEDILIRPNGTILVGGYFTTYRGLYYPFFIVLNSNGSISSTFNIGSGFDDIVNTIQLQPDGKILVGGRFSSCDNTTSNYIIRLNSNGSIDDTFNIGDGFDFFVNTIALQPDGKILVGGDFTSYDSEDSPYIIKLNSDGTISPRQPFNNNINYIYNPNLLNIKMDVINNKLVLKSDFNIYGYILNFKLFEITNN